MTKLIKNSSILAIIFASSNALAAWTIPGTECVANAMYGADEGYAQYHDDGIINTRVQNSKYDNMEVVCSSPVHHSYGNVLDMDFVVRNNATNQELSCIGFSHDKYGNIVHQTERVTTGTTTLPIKLTARQSREQSTAKVVTVSATCTLPDRSKDGTRTNNPSQIINVRVY